MTAGKDLGSRQRGVLEALAAPFPAVPERQRAYHAGCGWAWRDHSTTIRILTRLELRGLVRRQDTPDGWAWIITAAGLTAIRVSPLPMLRRQLASGRTGEPEFLKEMYAYHYATGTGPAVPRDRVARARAIADLDSARTGSAG